MKNCWEQEREDGSGGTVEEIRSVLLDKVPPFPPSYTLSNHYHNKKKKKSNALLQSPTFLDKFLTQVVLTLTKRVVVLLLLSSVGHGSYRSVRKSTHRTEIQINRKCSTYVYTARERE